MLGPRTPLYPPTIAAIGRALARRHRFGPDLWVAMGALAIATLAAAQIVLAGRALHAQLGWLPDAALATWAAASAWVLPLVLWEVRARATWRYGFTRWSFVFPLGMYSVASETLAHAVALAPLLDVALASFAAALAAWTLAALGLARAAVRGRR